MIKKLKKKSFSLILYLIPKENKNRKKNRWKKKVREVKHIFFSYLIIHGNFKGKKEQKIQFSLFELTRKTGRKIY